LNKGSYKIRDNDFIYLSTIFDPENLSDKKTFDHHLDTNEHDLLMKHYKDKLKLFIPKVVAQIKINSKNNHSI
jgi:hypothetical protein